MRKVYLTLLLAALASLGLVRSVSAEITMAVTGVTLSGPAGSPAQALHDNGWTGYLLTLQADATSKTVGGFDFGSQVQYLTWYSTIPLDYGITGTFAEVNSWDGLHTISRVTSPTGSLPTGSTTARSDSYFSDQIASTGFMQIPFAENSVVPHPGDPDEPYVYPYPNSDSLMYVLGSAMEGAGVVFGYNQTQTLPLAFIITPVGQPVHVRGEVVDGTPQANAWLLDFTFNQPTVVNAFAFGVPVPEPVSLAMLIPAAALLLRRRRR